MKRRNKDALAYIVFYSDIQIVHWIFKMSLTAHRYLEIFEGVFPELIENIPLCKSVPQIITQDSFSIFPDNKFSQKWIRTDGPVVWPLRTPDTSILDFFGVIYKI